MNFKFIIEKSLKQKESGEPACPRTDQELNPNSDSELLQKENTMTAVENSEISSMDEDLHWPIALRKGV